MKEEGEIKLSVHTREGSSKREPIADIPRGWNRGANFSHIEIREKNPFLSCCVSFDVCVCVSSHLSSPRTYVPPVAPAVQPDREVLAS